MKKWLEEVPGLRIWQAIVTELIIENEQIKGVVTRDGSRIKADSVILTPGTFLNGLIHIGLEHYSAGRANEPPATELAASLKSCRSQSIKA